MIYSWPMDVRAAHELAAGVCAVAKKAKRTTLLFIPRKSSEVRSGPVLPAGARLLARSCAKGRLVLCDPSFLALYNSYYIR